MPFHAEAGAVEVDACQERYCAKVKPTLWIGGDGVDAVVLRELLIARWTVSCLFAAGGSAGEDEGETAPAFV